MNVTETGKNIFPKPRFLFSRSDSVLQKEIYTYSKEDMAFMQPFPFAVYMKDGVLVLNKYVELEYKGKRVNFSFPVSEYKFVADLLLDFLRGDQWFCGASRERTEIIKELVHDIYVEPRFPARVPSSRYQAEITKRKAHLYNVARIKAPVASDIAEKINEKISKMKNEGKPIPEMPDYNTSDGMEACMEILKIRPPKVEGYRFPTSDDLIFWALEETTRQELVVAPCKECGQLFVKEAKSHFCSRHCADLNKVDCGRFCNDKEIASLYNAIYKALTKEVGRSAQKYIYRNDMMSLSENENALFSDLSTKYKNFTHTKHIFSESDFEVMNQTFRKSMFASKYESFKCIYRRYKIQELTKEEYDVARTEFLDWLREVKNQVDNFVRE